VTGKLEGLTHHPVVRDAPGLAAVVGALDADTFGGGEVRVGPARDGLEGVDDRLSEPGSGERERVARVDRAIDAERGYVRDARVRRISEERSEAAHERVRLLRDGNPGTPRVG
jgi:hypothetical protein